MPAPPTAPFQRPNTLGLHIGVEIEIGIEMIRGSRLDPDFDGSLLEAFSVWTVPRINQSSVTADWKVRPPVAFAIPPIPVL